VSAGAASGTALSPWTFSGEAALASGGSVTLVSGPSFVICDRRGDITGQGPSGLFVGDRRVLSRLVLHVAGELIEPLACTLSAPFSVAIAGRTSDHRVLVLRELHVGRGLRTDVRLRNLDDCTHIVDVLVSVGTDLAGVMEVKEEHEVPPMVPVSVVGTALHLGAASSDSGSIVRVHPAGLLDAETATIAWRVVLGPKHEWAACLEVSAVRAGKELRSLHRCGQPVESSPATTLQAAWEAALPQIASDVPDLALSIRRAGTDIGALRIFDPAHPREPVVAAGAPWFMTLFGRDSILTAWMSLILGPSLALSTATTLARLQGTKYDDATEEQPGRILHEVRQEGRASLSFASGNVYYGTADATPLFVMLVGELWRWGTAPADVRQLLPAVDAALQWVAGPGDPDGDGYVEYQRTSDSGLVNQGWKDSWDGVSFADGRLPEAPIALAEVQGYAYAAWRAGAALATSFGDDERATERNARADALKRRFNADFWLSDRGAYAMALDRTKRPVDAVASNMGHCLWTGIIDEDRTAAVAAWLVSAELFSGWGVRTLATSMERYDPLSYHNGSVWPHDTAICAAGLRRAGFVDESRALTHGLLSAAATSSGRLPELFAGLTPHELPVPVPYPASCSPQAWASAAPLLLLRSLLGLEPDLPNRKVAVDPVLPVGSSELRLESLELGGHRVSIDVAEGTVRVTGLEPDVTVVEHLQAYAKPDVGRYQAEG
jgi:glycogen debranching enzyme